MKPYPSAYQGRYMLRLADDKLLGSRACLCPQAHTGIQSKVQRLDSVANHNCCAARVLRQGCGGGRLGGTGTVQLRSWMI